MTCVRGKSRHGFDLAVRLSWKEESDGGRELKGTAELPDASRTSVEDEELDFTLQIDRACACSAAEAAAVKAAGQLWRAAALRALQQLNSELAAKANT